MPTQPTNPIAEAAQRLAAALGHAVDRIDAGRHYRIRFAQSWRGQWIDLEAEGKTLLALTIAADSPRERVRMLLLPAELDGAVIEHVIALSISPGIAPSRHFRSMPGGSYMTPQAAAIIHNSAVA
jgi:hypothetical protein